VEGPPGRRRVTDARGVGPPPGIAPWPLVGRQPELAALAEAVAGLAGGVGGLVLVEGEAGVGKTALVESVLSSVEARVLRGIAHGGGPPYGPLTAAFRAHPSGPARDAVDDLGPVPGLHVGWQARGPVAQTETGEDFAQAVRDAFGRLARTRPTVVFLDDLQWVDAATVTVLSGWTAPLADLPLLVIGAFRRDALARDHPLRGLRSGLRRARGGRQRHLRLEALRLEDSTLLVRRVLGDEVAPEIVGIVHRRAHGLPFFVEELAASIADLDDRAAQKWTDVIPESVRDAVLQECARLSGPARLLAEILAAGAPLELDVLAGLAPGEEAVEELFDSGLVTELPAVAGGTALAAFRHGLVGEALHAATPWPRRRRHHVALAEALEGRKIAPAVVAAHWEQAHESGLARPWLLAAAEAACGVHAYRDAKEALDRALAWWPAAEDEGSRLAAVARLGECAERCGELAEAIRAWQQVAAAHRAAGDLGAQGEVERRLGGLYELTNDWTRALEARSVASDAFARVGWAADAAEERLAAAAHLQSAGEVTGALQLVQAAKAEIGTAGSESAAPVAGLRVRAMALEGSIRAKLGEATIGVELGRRALELALDSDIEGLAADVYYLYGDTLEMASDYLAALQTMTEGLTYCRRRGLAADAQVCLACLTPALRHTGQWDRTLEVGREVLAADDAPEVARMVAAGEIGLVLVNRGKAAQARRHLALAAAFARVHELFGLEIEAAWGLARADVLEGETDRAEARLRELSLRCRAREERHYSVAALRWASTFFARRGSHHDLGGCTDALASIAAATGTAEATGALAHALGECALSEGDARRAADQFERALELLDALSLPPETAETQLRAGVALAAVGDREKGVGRLVGAYHTARALGARPLAASAVSELEAIGEDVRRRLGRRAARQADAAGLTPREREVLGFVATGLTNRQIAAELFLSPRTVDMHLRNLMATLGCRTRTEAVRRAEELALLEAPVP
jgi:DNA-binding CsgD family transcriptional regulator